MILNVTFSKPVNNINELLGNDFIKIKCKLENSSNGTGYFIEEFTKTKVFHKHFTLEELNNFIEKNAGITFKNVIIKTDTQEITILANKKGKITKLTKDIDSNLEQNLSSINNSNKQKNYILHEGQQIPFLQVLGISNEKGKILSNKYDKFKQINRFLEFIDDIIDDISQNVSESNPLKIVDFGCGKAYLTFAVQYYLTNIKKIPNKIFGLDLKKEVIDYCNDICNKLKINNLSFNTGDISTFKEDWQPDLIITLHACDTATDYALKYANEHNAKAILSVPCCQHQINTQLSKKIGRGNDDFNTLLKYGYIREKFSALLTDALRGQWLENQGYKVQMLEFIDEEHTPKNLLIRAVKKGEGTKKIPSIIQTLDINPEIWK